MLPGRQVYKALDCEHDPEQLRMQSATVANFGEKYTQGGQKRIWGVSSKGWDSSVTLQAYKLVDDLCFACFALCLYASMLCDPSAMAYVVHRIADGLGGSLMGIPDSLIL